MPEGLSYYMHDEAAAFRFRLAGDLSQGSTADLDQARLTASSVLDGRSLVVDLTGIVSIDTAGRQLIEKWRLLGAQFVVTTSLAKLRIQSMTDVPVRFLEREGSGWRHARTLASLLRRARWKH